MNRILVDPNIVLDLLAKQEKFLVEVLPMDDEIIDLSLEPDFKDFEDVIQYHTAIENEINILITRNLKYFKKSKKSLC